MKNIYLNIIILIAFVVLNTFAMSAGDSKLQDSKLAQPVSSTKVNSVNKANEVRYIDGVSAPKSNSTDCITPCTDVIIHSGVLDLGDIYWEIPYTYNSDNYITFEIHSCVQSITITRTADVVFPNFVVLPNTNVTSNWKHGFTSACTSNFTNNSVNVQIPITNKVYVGYSYYYVYYVRVFVTSVKAPSTASVGLHWAHPSISVSEYTGGCGDDDDDDDHDHDPHNPHNPHGH